jgi:hypothetical protein
VPKRDVPLQRRNNILALRSSACHYHFMRDFEAWRKASVRYWERRRIAYNVLLAVPAFLGWGFGGALSAAVGDKDKLSAFTILLLFALGASAANICYSFVYVFEFVFASDDPKNRWNAQGRPAVFVFGTLVSILLALVAGRNIGIAQFSGIRFF